MASILFPLPDHDFDVTEVAVPWRLLRDPGHEPGDAYVIAKKLIERLDQRVLRSTAGAV